MKSALLVVDMQEFFLAPDAPAFFPGAEPALGEAVLLARAFREAGLPVAFSTYVTAAGSPMSSRWRKTCVADGRWARVASGLARRLEEPVFVKSGYSVLKRASCLSWLRETRARTLVVAGVKTHLCVESTVRDAFEAGFDVEVASDACAAPREADHAASLRVMAQGFARVRAAREIAGTLLEHSEV